MNKLEEIREFIRNFVYEKKEIQQQIKNIEEKRIELAQERNNAKKTVGNNGVVVELGKQIAELGCKSQELQNKLEYSFKNIKIQAEISIDNLITEEIRKIRKMQEEVFELEEKIKEYSEKNAKYELQKQEFYERFGRIPELSENAQVEIKIQEQHISIIKQDEKRIKNEIEEKQNELVDLVQVRRDLKNKDWAKFENNKSEENIEELTIEDFKPIEEFNKVKERNVLREFEVIGVKESADELEKLTKAIVEEIAEEEEEIIRFEKEEKQDIKAFEGKVTLLNVIAKIEDGEVVYKSQLSNGEEIKVYPTKSNTGNLLLNYKEKRKEFESILKNYAMANKKMLDKKAIMKIDPIICEIIVEFANKYDYEVQKLIYNYAMSFSKYEEYNLDRIPQITYNLSYTTTLGTVLSKREKTTISKLCKDARKNKKIDIIGYITIINKIRYILKRIFTTNKIKVLSEGKY